MRSPTRRLAAVTGAAIVALTAACSSAAPTEGPTPTNAASTSTSGAAPVAAVPGGLVPATVTVPPGLDEAPLDTERQALIPPGWSMSVWARVPEARLATWTPDGAMLVSRPETGEVLKLTPGGGAPTESVLLSGLEQPHGLTFAGSTLYVAQSNRVDAHDYVNGRVGPARPIAADLPDSESPDLRGAYAHALKSVAVGPDGSTYVSVGSTGNVSPEDRTATPPRASILRIPPGGGAPETFASGVRNGTGLAVAPDGAVWTAVNNRDNLAYPHEQPYADVTGSAQGQVFPQYVNDHPAEALAKLTPGRELGWPYCHPDPDVNPGVAGTPLDFTAPPFVRDVETNADGSRLDCASLPPVEQSMGGHSAPLGLSFATTGLPAPYAQGALVGVHGSWNATPPRAPEVSFFPWENGTLGAQQTLVGGFQAADGSRWGRPVAALAGPDGAVYVTDDEAGAVYRLAPPGR